MFSFPFTALLLSRLIVHSTLAFQYRPLSRSLPSLVHGRRIGWQISNQSTSRWNLYVAKGETSSEGDTKTRTLSYPTLTPDDEKLLSGILKDLKVDINQVPWNKLNMPAEGSTRTFNYVLQQIATYHEELDNPGARAEQVLRYMLDQQPDRPELLPNDYTLNNVLSAYTNSLGHSIISYRQRIKAADKCYNLLEEWQNILYPSQMTTHDADRVSYNTVISAYAKAGKYEQAESVFEELQQKCKKANNDDSLKPDAITYNCLLNALAAGGQADKVGQVFQAMRTDPDVPQPTIHSYNDVLYAYSKSKQPIQAEEFLQWWIEEAKGEDTKEISNKIVPNTYSYNIVLHAMTKALKNQWRAAQYMEKQSADLITTNMLKRAKILFDTMPRRDNISYTTFISALCEHAKITTKKFGSPSLDAVKEIVDRAYEDSAIQVDSAFVSNVLYSLAVVENDRNAPGVAEEIVEDMIHVHKIVPSIDVYNALIHCWGKSSSRDDVTWRVLEILKELELQPSNPDLKANIVTYTNALDALKGRGLQAVEAAEAIVTRMETDANCPPPNVMTYTALIQNYSRSKLAFKATKAAEVLKRIKEQKNCRPNIISYNAVLNACEYTDPSDRSVTEEALRVACLIFDEIRSAPTVVPNHVTYGTFLGTLAKLMPVESRQEIVGLVFRRCCMNGQVSRLVLKKLRDAAESHEKYVELLAGHQEDRLPREWTCNVQESRARHQA